MTNGRTAFGAALWMAVNGLMLLAALEPVSIEVQPAQIAARPATASAA